MRSDCRASGLDLRPVARPEQGDRRRPDEGRELVDRRRERRVDESEGDRELAVGRLAGRREVRGPGVLVTVEHHEARVVVDVPERGERAEQDRAVPAHEEGSVPLRCDRAHPLRGGRDEVRQRGFIEQAAGAAPPVGR